MLNRKLLVEDKVWLALIGVGLVYLIFLLFQAFSFKALERIYLILIPLFILMLVASLEKDRTESLKFSALALLLIILNTEFNIVTARYKTYIGNGFQMLTFFALILGGAVTLCHYDLKKTGRKMLNFGVVSGGFVLFYGLLGATVVYAIR